MSYKLLFSSAVAWNWGCNQALDDNGDVVEYTDVTTENSISPAVVCDVKNIRQVSDHGSPCNQGNWLEWGYTSAEAA